LDTNVVIRILINDDPEQARRAAKMVTHNQVFISKTVFVESEWVLRKACKLDRRSIQNAFEYLLGLPYIHVEDPTVIQTALEGYSRGLDFADGVHLASSHKAAKFATFDRKLIKNSCLFSGVIEVVEP
jgi:predicted nucleic-acid-binding protein